MSGPVPAGGSDGDHHGGATEGERFWEGHYRGRDQVFSGHTNPVLVEVAGLLRPGAALDLGCGEGGDAIWLARHGWRVTAVDVAATALERAAEHARTAGVADRITFERHDLTRSAPTGVFDLVSAMYLQSPVSFAREEVLRSVARAVTVGGLLLVVDHGSVPPWSWADPDTPFPTPDELLVSLRLPAGQWHPERLEAPRRRASGPGGQSATVTDTVVAVPRRGGTDRVDGPGRSLRGQRRLQRNVLDRQRWATRHQLRLAIVTWIERTYHRRRRQRALGRLTPVEYETITTGLTLAA